MRFPVPYDQILERVRQVDPIKYGQTRNFRDGAITHLSPYISRGVISTKQVLESVLSAGHVPHSIEKFIQELAWRDYWQQCWISKGHLIDDDLRQKQPRAERMGIPLSISNHQTGIETIDNGIAEFYEDGFLHNHLRMYIASLACNLARCHWKMPAQWMYYHLLDADWASNALSWQWVSGANSNKLYFANQENINKYFYSNQRNSFLDIGYDEIDKIGIPETLLSLESPVLKTTLPDTDIPIINPELPTLIYNFYNLDSEWRRETKANRILLLEPSIFEKYPVSSKSLDFCIALAKQNIPDIQVWVSEFSHLKSIVPGKIYFKEHPLNNYDGYKDERDWLCSVKGDYPSFFAFWKKVKKNLY